MTSFINLPGSGKPVFCFQAEKVVHLFFVEDPAKGSLSSPPRPGVDKEENQYIQM